MAMNRKDDPHIRETPVRRPHSAGPKASRRVPWEVPNTRRGSADAAAATGFEVAIPLLVVLHEPDAGANQPAGGQIPVSQKIRRK
jgi:hypothetical protein